MVQFGNPAALWLLTLVIPIVLLYLLKRRRKDTVVPSILLWAKVVDDVRAQTPFQKLRSSLLLWLQILAIVLFTAILSRPYIPIRNREVGRWIVVLDTSASMKATDVSPSRFQKVREEVIGFVDGLPPEDELMLLSMSGSISVEQGYSRNRTAFRSRLEDLKPEDLDTNWQELKKLLDPLLKESPAPAIVIASDFSNFPSDLFAGISFQSMASGRTGVQMGITGAALHPVPENLVEYELFFQIKNFSDQSDRAEAVVSLDHRVLDAFELRFSPGETRTRSLTVRITKQALLRIQVNPADVFPLDNDFTFIAYPRKKIPVQLDSQNPFLMQALRSLPGVEVTQSASIAVGEFMKEESAGIFFLKGDQRAGPVVGWNSLHPAFQFVDAGLWKFSQQSRLNLPDDAVVLLESTEGPVLYATDENGLRRCVAGFALDQSNLPLLAGLPIFLQNSLEWIQEGIQPPLPQSTSESYRSEGEYDIHGRKTYVNFLSATESNIQPQKPQGTRHRVARAASLQRDLSSWFVVALIAVLALEWWVFHRRVGEE